MGGVVAKQKVEPIVRNRLAAGPVNVLGTTRSTLCNVDGGLETAALESVLGRPKQAAVAEKLLRLVKPKGLDTARCRNQGSEGK